VTKICLRDVQRVMMVKAFEVILAWDMTQEGEERKIGHIFFELNLRFCWFEATTVDEHIGK